MSITIQLSRQDIQADGFFGGVVSDAIATYTHGWPSHVDVVMPDGQLLGARSDVCMGVPAGVQLRPPNYAVFSKTERISFPAIALEETAFYAFLSLQYGKPYDKLAITGLALDRDWRSPYHWFCSELVMAALEAGQIIHRITSPLNFISPRDVLVLAEAMGAPA